jgi:hypothetical protein
MSILELMLCYIFIYFKGPSGFPVGANNTAENNQNNNDDGKKKKGKHSFLSKRSNLRGDLLPPLTDYNSDGVSVCIDTYICNEFVHK